MTDLLPFLDGRQTPNSLAGRAALGALGGLGRLYGGIQALRAWGYRHGLPPTFRPPCPVISVGNLTAGGTGKTPMVRWLAQQLRAMGKNPAIVSRGYGQEARGAVTVVADRSGLLLSPPLAADEAVLLARNLPGVPVLTGKKRIHPIRHAIERLGADIILLDDGFQHLQVARDLNLLLMDCRHPLGNGRLLPGGILRESPAALARCDAIVLTRARQPQWRHAARQLLAGLAPDKPLLFADHQPAGWHPLGGPSTPLPEPFPGPAPVFACAGIARPDAFRETLAALGVNLVGFHPFPDHHPFSAAAMARLNAMARQAGAAFLLCTEKDAVKMDAATLEMPTFFLGLELVFLENPGWLWEKMGLL